MYSQKEPVSTTISLTGEVTQFIWQIHVFLKKTTIYAVLGDTSTHPQVYLKW